eukprot:m.13715 g.13715  ORF g.13715 m.13715 type:complete len:661 (-) comp10194_c0_seq1:38-2020(-)
MTEMDQNEVGVEIAINAVSRSTLNKRTERERHGGMDLNAISTFIPCVLRVGPQAKRLYIIQAQATKLYLQPDFADNHRMVEKDGRACWVAIANVSCEGFQVNDIVAVCYTLGGTFFGFTVMTTNRGRETATLIATFMAEDDDESIVIKALRGALNGSLQNNIRVIGNIKDVVEHLYHLKVPRGQDGQSAKGICGGVSCVFFSTDKCPRVLRPIVARKWAEAHARAERKRKAACDAGTSSVVHAVDMPVPEVTENNHVAQHCDMTDRAGHDGVVSSVGGATGGGGTSGMLAIPQTFAACSTPKRRRKKRTCTRFETHRARKQLFPEEGLYSAGSTGSAGAVEDYSTADDDSCEVPWALGCPPAGLIDDGGWGTVGAVPDVGTDSCSARGTDADDASNLRAAGTADPGLAREVVGGAMPSLTRRRPSARVWDSGDAVMERSTCVAAEHATRDFVISGWNERAFWGLSPGPPSTGAGSASCSGDIYGQLCESIEDATIASFASWPSTDATTSGGSVDHESSQDGMVGGRTWEAIDNVETDGAGVGGAVLNGLGMNIDAWRTNTGGFARDVPDSGDDWAADDVLGAIGDAHAGGWGTEDTCTVPDIEAGTPDIDFDEVIGWGMDLGDASKGGERDLKQPEDAHGRAWVLGHERYRWSIGDRGVE